MDYEANTITENTRASYPIEHIGEGGSELGAPASPPTLSLPPRPSPPVLPLLLLLP